LEVSPLIDEMTAALNLRRAKNGNTITCTWQRNLAAMHADVTNQTDFVHLLSNLASLRIMVDRGGR